MKKILHILACLALLANVKYANAQHSDTLYSTADVYIVTYGGGEGKNSFLKFDMSSIPTANVITEVKLRVYVTDISAMWDADAEFSRVNKQTWLESDPNDTLWAPANFTDTLLQINGFAAATGWTESIDIKSLFSYDYSIANTYFTVMVKDADDMTMAPGPYPPYDSNDSMMVGNIFNDYMVFAPHEYSTPAYIPQLIVNYTLVPLITAQSDDSTKCEMEDVQFYTSATGDNLEYQWQKNGVDIPAANGDTLLLSALALADGALYRCIVSNAVAADTTNEITLLVNPLPVVDLGVDTTLCADASITLEAGLGNDSYIWSDLSTAHDLLVDSNSYGLGTSIIYVDVTKSGCTQRDSIEITFVICSNISEQEKGYLSIYPNPVANDLNISYDLPDTEGASFVLYSVEGKVLMQKSLLGNQNKITLNTSSLCNGMYFYKVINDQDGLISNGTLNVLR